MDDLIILIVRGLIALFSGGKSEQPPRQPQQPKIAPRVPPALPQSPAARRQMQQGPRLTPLQKQQAMLQQIMRRGKAPKNAQRPAPPPPPRPVVASPKPSAPSEASARPQASKPSISAAMIGQLISSHPTAIRTMYVLSEVIQPPLALRPDRNEHS